MHKSGRVHAFGIAIKCSRMLSESESTQILLMRQCKHSAEFVFAELLLPDMQMHENFKDFAF